MGDRVLFQVCRGEEFSPVIYGHWAGDAAPAICEALQKRMVGRSDDVDYTAARLVQELADRVPGNLSVGMWNAEAILTEKESHGDAGCVLIECASDKLRFKAFGGYLTATDSGVAVMP